MKYTLAVALTFLVVACYPSAKEVCEGSVETQCTVALRCTNLLPDGAAKTGGIAYFGGDLAGCKTKFNATAGCDAQTGKAEAAVCSEGTTGIEWGKIQDCRDELRDAANLTVCAGTIPAACLPTTGYCTGGTPKAFVSAPTAQ